MKLIVISLSLLFLPFAALADMNEYAQQYLQRLEDQKLAVFCTTCKASGNPKYKAILLFEVGKRQGLLIETQESNVNNLATGFSER